MRGCANVRVADLAINAPITSRRTNSRLGEGLQRSMVAYKVIAIVTAGLGLGLVYPTVNYARLTDQWQPLPCRRHNSEARLRVGIGFRIGLSVRARCDMMQQKRNRGTRCTRWRAALSAYLVDMSGRELHRWSVSPEQAMPGETAKARTGFGLLKPQVEVGHLFPNGELLLIYAQPVLGAWDTRLIKVDKNSRILWNSQVSVHHAVAVVGDRIYALTRPFKPPSPTPVIPSILPGCLIWTKALVCSIRGQGPCYSFYPLCDCEYEELAFSGRGAIRSPCCRCAAFKFDRRPDRTNCAFHSWGQTRQCVVVPKKPRYADRDGSGHGDHCLDAARQLAKAARCQDALERPHPTVRQRRRPDDGGRSRVLEINPKTAGIVWSYNGTDDDPLDSEIRGSAGRLSNGDTLISKSTGGHILEVTPDASVVWEYVKSNPRYRARSHTHCIIWSDSPPL